MADAAHAAAPTREQVIANASAMMEALRCDDLELAERELETLASTTGRSMDHPDVLFFRVVIAIQRGQSREALQYLNELGDDAAPELKVLCLYSLQDPYWEGLAQEVAETGSPAAKLAMQRMLATYAAVKAGAH